MITAVQAIGEYFELDEAGYLVNPANWNHVPVEWQEAINTIKEAYLNFYQQNLHSLYLRGSMVRGTFREGISDLDVFGLIHEKGIQWDSTPFEAAITQNIQAKFSKIKTIELMVSSYAVDLSAIYPSLAMVLKTQSLCIFGTDASSTIQPFKIGQSLAVHYRWLEEDLSVFLRKDTFEEADLQAIMKIIIRSGFELVIERGKEFTLDLYPAVQSFGKYYPAQKAMMESILFYFLNPGENQNEQLKLLVTFGDWLVKEVDRVLK